MLKRILLVDDNAAIRQALRTCLELRDGLQICGEACDGLDAIEKAKALEPDVVVLDISMPRMSGLQAARELKLHKPALAIIIFTLHKNTYMDRQAIAAGADAVVAKSDGVDVLFKQIELC